MFEGVDIMQFGVFGGAFFLLFGIFIRYVMRNEEFVKSLIDNNRDEMRMQREAFTEALHEITKKLVAIDVKLDEHIRSSDK